MHLDIPLLSSGNFVLERQDTEWTVLVPKAQCLTVWSLEFKTYFYWLFVGLLILWFLTAHMDPGEKEAFLRAEEDLLLYIDNDL